MPICNAQYLINPLQSNSFGPSPPQTYGLPRCALAKVNICSPGLRGERGLNQHPEFH